MIIISISINVFDYFTIKDIFDNILFIFLRELTFCLEICLAKYVMENNYCSPYEVCFYIGLFCSFFILITFVINGFYEDHKYFNDVLEYVNEIDYKEISINKVIYLYYN